MSSIEHKVVLNFTESRGFIKPPEELKKKEPLLLSPDNIEILNPYDFKDLTATWDILNDPQQSYRFENQAETPHVLSDIARNPKVTVYVVKHPATHEIIATASTTDPSAKSREFETWWEHVATRVDMHGRGIGTQLGEAIFFDKFFQRRGPGNKFAEKIYTAAIVDGDHGPALKTMKKLGFIPRARWEKHIGVQAPVESAIEGIARSQRDEEERFDSVRWELTRTMFLLGIIDGKYDYLNRAHVNEGIIGEAMAKNIDIAKLRQRVEAYKIRNDRSADMRDILDPLGL